MSTVAPPSVAMVPTQHGLECPHATRVPYSHHTLHQQEKEGHGQGRRREVPKAIRQIVLGGNH